MTTLHVASIAAVATNRFFVAATIKISHSDRAPTKLSHNLCQASKRAGRPVALRDLKKIQQRLTADALQLIKEVDLAAHALQCEPPGIGHLCRSKFRCLFILSLNVNARMIPPIAPINGEPIRQRAGFPLVVFAASAAAS